MPRPYPFADDHDAVNMIRHDDEFIDRDARKMPRDSNPAIMRDTASGRQFKATPDVPAKKGALRYEQIVTR